MDDSVYFRRIQREEFLILQGLRAGKALGQSIALAFKKSSVPLTQRSESVHQWFQNWATLGWFCR